MEVLLNAASFCTKLTHSALKNLGKRDDYHNIMVYCFRSTQFDIKTYKQIHFIMFEFWDC